MRGAYNRPQFSPVSEIQSQALREVLTSKKNVPIKEKILWLFRNCVKAKE
jgi:hypothetical protein